MRKSSTFICLLLLASVVPVWAQKTTGTPEEVVYKGNPTSPISSYVTVPSGRKYFFSSGSTAPAINAEAAEGSRERYGDTKAQAIGILERFKVSLAEEGLTLRDVIFMRVYIAPDVQTGKLDFQGWFDAYAQFFGTKENPTKPSRSTVGIAQLVNPNKFIEIEIVAVYK